MYSFRFLVSLLLLSLGTATYEVPTKKAVPPKMDPIPTLPVVTHRAYLDIEIDGNKVGRIVVGLFGQVAPKAAENFAALCACDHGKGKITGKDLCYKGSKIHRVIPNFMIQGGDFTHGDGTGGESIWGGNFEDESLHLKHNRHYMLCMANSGKKNTNRSQWYINTVKTQWLDGKSEVFGMVLEGKSVITEIEKMGTLIGKTRGDVVITNSGVLPVTDADATPRLVSERLEL
eukprot:Nitzschia sp. Nitz4//scaffold46_size129759//82360//83145//NITZ4_003511-RA/size129759-augustus-gene-0.11-mRNA-1//1//CDS//3329552625//5498//frame0